MTANAVFLPELLEIILSPQMLEVFVIDREIAREHGCCDLAAVGAVADERVDEAGGLRGLGRLG